MNYAQIEHGLNELGEKVCYLSNRYLWDYTCSSHNITKTSLSKIRNYVKFQARQGLLAIEDMDGGTFTISNGGVFGSLMGTPIINPPQSAILGMHGIFERPVAIKGKVCSHQALVTALLFLYSTVTMVQGNNSQLRSGYHAFETCARLVFIIYQMLYDLFKWFYVVKRTNAKNPAVPFSFFWHPFCLIGS